MRQSAAGAGAALAAATPETLPPAPTLEAFAAAQLDEEQPHVQCRDAAEVDEEAEPSPAACQRWDWP